MNINQTIEINRLSKWLYSHSVYLLLHKCYEMLIEFHNLKILAIITMSLIPSCIWSHENLFLAKFTILTNILMTCTQGVLSEI